MNQCQYKMKYDFSKSNLLMNIYWILLDRSFIEQRNLCNFYLSFFVFRYFRNGFIKIQRYNLADLRFISLFTFGGFYYWYYSSYYSTLYALIFKNQNISSLYSFLIMICNLYNLYFNSL